MGDKNWISFPSFHRDLIQFKGRKCNKDCRYVPLRLKNEWGQIGFLSSPHPTLAKAKGTQEEGMEKRKKILLLLYLRVGCCSRATFSSIHPPIDRRRLQSLHHPPPKKETVAAAAAWVLSFFLSLSLVVREWNAWYISFLSPSNSAFR